MSVQQVQPSMAAEVRDNVGRMQITPENVMAIHHALATEAQLILNEVRKARMRSHVGIAAQDPVSKPAADGFNAKITQHLDQCQEYGVQLNLAAEQMAATARGYGHTEDEITNSFRAFNTAYQEKYAL